jgi:hypothetical protein
MPAARRIFPTVKAAIVWPISGLTIRNAFRCQDRSTVLVAEGEDLSVEGVAGGDYPPEPVENEANQSGQAGHVRGTLPASLWGPD